MRFIFCTKKLDQLGVYITIVTSTLYVLIKLSKLLKKVTSTNKQIGLEKKNAIHGISNKSDIR